LLIIFPTSVGGDVAASKDKSHGKKASKMLSAMKTSIKGTIETTLGADHLKAKAGSKPSKQRLGVIPRNRANHLSGPIAFKCRYHGRRGHAYISTKETIPCIGFSFDKAIGKNGEDTLGKDEVYPRTAFARNAFIAVHKLILYSFFQQGQIDPIWSIAIADIAELKKIGGLGWKAKLVVGWALEREVSCHLYTPFFKAKSFTTLVL
jgi:hypothetical protein